MSQSTSLIPDEALFFVADQHMRVNDLLAYLYEHPSPKTAQHFRRVNEHLQDGWVKLGQMVIITPADPSACNKWEDVMMEAAAKVDEELAGASEKERRTLARHYAFLSDAANYSGTLYGWTNVYFDQKKKHVERILKNIEQLYVETYNRTGSLNSNGFFTKRRALFLQLDQTVNGMMEKKMFGQDVSASRLRAELGLSSKAAVHQWKKQGGAASVPEFATNYHRLAQTAKTFSRLGYVAIALDVGSSATKIHAACTAKPGSAECSKTKYAETGRALGSVGGGAAAGALASWGVCTLVFGLPSAGSSFLWCAIAVGGAGGYAGSQVLGKAGGAVGETIYESSTRPR